MDETSGMMDDAAASVNPDESSGMVDNPQARGNPMTLGDESAPATDPAALRRRIAAHVRDHRARAGLSLAEVATRAGVGKSTLHQLETGEANPSIETLWAVAEALGVPFGELIEPPPSAVRVIRSTEGIPVEASESGMRARLLTSSTQMRRLEVYSLDFGEGPARAAEPHIPGTVEHVLVTSGSLRTGPTGDEVDLDVGDLATFPGDVEHHYAPLKPGTSVILLMDYR